MTAPVGKLVQLSGTLIVEVQRPKLRDEMLRDYIISLLIDDKTNPRVAQYRRGFAKIISRTVSINQSDLHCLKLTMTSTKEEAEEAFETFLDLDNEDTEKWAIAVDDFEKGKTTSDQKPAELLTEAEQADPN